MARLSLLFVVACAAASASLQATQAQALGDITPQDLQNAALLLNNLPAAFQVFKEKFQKTYPGTQDQQRYLTFAANIINAAGALSAQNPGATFGVTPYSDMTESEFAREYLSNVPTFTQGDADQLCNASDPSAVCNATVDNARRSFGARSLQNDAHRLDFEDLPESFRKRKAYKDFGKVVQPEDDMAPPQNKAFDAAEDLPTQVDWRTKGVVSSIKYQGACGACWAFVVTGVVESLWGIAGHQVPDLSEQQLLSCVALNQKCDGGIMQYAYDWVVRSNGGYLASEEYYPYVSADEIDIPACSNTGAGAAAKINSYVSISRSEAQLQKYVANNGPVSISIEAYGWQSYTGGVLSSCNNLMTTHAVVVVGYDTTASPPYWICKNSWSSDWGENGYIRIEMWKNVCLIADNPSTGLITSELTEALPTGDPSRRVKNAASGLAIGAVAISTLASMLAFVL